MLPHTSPPPLVRAVLVIDDEPQIRRAVANAMRDLAERVLEAGTAGEGINLAAAERPDLIVLDLGLPDTDGSAVCREIRAWTMTPILVLSARHAEAEKVQLLNAGADDYVTKPFSPAELAARCRALLRRAALRAPNEAGLVDLGGLEIDLARRTVNRDGERVHLTPTEFEILRTLVAQEGRTLTHQQIFDAVWHREYGNAQQNLRVHITNLRRKIERDPTDPRIIVTEPGVGYRAESGR